MDAKGQIRPVPTAKARKHFTIDRTGTGKLNEVITMTEEEYFKLKAIKEKHIVSWNELIAYANRLLEKDKE